MEAAIIVSVLLSFVEQLMLTGKVSHTSNSPNGDREVDSDQSFIRQSHESTEYTETNPLLRQTTTAEVSGQSHADGLDQEERTRRLIARMKIQVWAGTGVGLLIATAIGAAFIAVVSIISRLSHLARKLTRDSSI